MRAPKPDADGVRRYGNFGTIAEDYRYCVASVWHQHGAWGSSLQCRRKRGHGPDGLWCAVHGKRAEAR